MNASLWQTLKTKLSNYLFTVRDTLTNYENQKFIIGPEASIGTVFRNVYQLMIYSIDATNKRVGGDPVDVSGISTQANVYVHLKLPGNINLNTWMHHVRVRGYSYGSAKIIDCTYVGYSYSPSNSFLNKEAMGTVTVDQYADTNGNIVLCFLLSSAYYSSFEVDTMRCGVNVGIKRGMIQCKLSTSNRVTFAV
jgi:hypothetical protein